MPKLLILLLALVPLVACQSTPLELKEPVEGTYEVIGPAEGKFGGILLFNFIPIAYNQRLWQAYQNALESKGADALIDVTVTDRWWWAPLVAGNVTTVQGTAVKLKNGAGKAAEAPKSEGGEGGKPAARTPESSAAPAEPAKPKVPRRKN